jgi:hypothetical protein
MNPPQDGAHDTPPFHVLLVDLSAASSAFRNPGFHYLILKGQSHDIFCIRFFHQSAHSGRTRDVL